MTVHYARQNACAKCGNSLNLLYMYNLAYKCLSLRNPTILTRLTILSVLSLKCTADNSIFQMLHVICTMVCQNKTEPNALTDDIVQAYFQCLARPAADYPLLNNPGNPAKSPHTNSQLQL